MALMVYSFVSLVIPCIYLEKSREFYESIGMKCTREQHGTGPVHYSTRLDETLLELYPIDPSTHAFMELRLGITVDDVRDTLKGMRGGEVLDHQFGSAFVRDPSGHKIHMKNAQV